MKMKNIKTMKKKIKRKRNGKQKIMTLKTKPQQQHKCKL